MSGAACTGTAHQAPGYAVQTPLKTYMHRSSDPLTACVLVLPLLMLYNAGLVLTEWGALNGADFITRSIVEHLGHAGFLAFQALLGIGFLLALFHLRRRQQLKLGDYIPLLGESLLYAATMGTVILHIMNRSDVLAVGAQAAPAWLRMLTISAGAGVHEELVFRLLLIPALLFFLRRTAGMSMGAAAVVAVTLSSLGFALAHYVGPEAFSPFTFAYRTMAGLWFATLFLFRGFAVAVYTPCLYDVYVLGFHA